MRTKNRSESDYSDIFPPYKFIMIKKQVHAYGSHAAFHDLTCHTI